MEVDDSNTLFSKEKKRYYSEILGGCVRESKVVSNYELIIII